MPNYMTNLVNFRKNKKVTQQELAYQIGISQQQWSDYERGRNEIPLRYFIIACQILGASADEILEINTPNPPL